MPEPVSGSRMKVLGLGFVVAAVLVISIWSIQTSKSDVAPSATESPKAAPTRTLDPARERRRVENARENELRDTKSALIEFNKSLGVLFVRGVQIDHDTLALTIDGSIWDNEADADKAALNAQMAALWSNVYNTYNKSAADLRVRLLDMDGTEIQPAAK